MAKQKLLSSLFTIVSKEEMEVNVEREFAALNSKLELEKAMKKPEAEKRPVGRPKKEMEVVLLPTKVETPVKSSSKPSKEQGNIHELVCALPMGSYFCNCKQAWECKECITLLAAEI
jgi:hypothetical protein